ncbi:MAG: hypothetical protein KA149_05925 [Chitinophagales bacterium]|nr:hypothetical protein [Chitinophagales bacterium]
MKGKKLQIFLLVFYAVLLVLIGVMQPTEINWTPTYSSADKIPYGNFVLYKQLQTLFAKNEVFTSEVPFYNYVNEQENQPANFIIVNNQCSADELDVNAMMNFVRDGGNVFIATNGLSAALEDSLGISITETIAYGRLANSDSGKTTPLYFLNPALQSGQSYNFKQGYVNYKIIDVDSVAKKTPVLLEHYHNRLPRIALGTYAGEDVNFARIPLGEGSFYIHSFPIAFTNYNMLKGNNNEYVAKCLSYLPNQTVYWDEYYKPNKFRAAQTPLRYILSVPAYRWAYYVAIFSILIYVVVYARRQQRIIPIIEPFKNLSLEFARTVGTLYYQQKDHRDLAEKKMTYFLERVRNHYYLATNLTNEDFQEKLAYKSNTEKETVKEIFRIYFNYIREQRSINEQILIVFNAALEKFYNESGLTNK